MNQERKQKLIAQSTSYRTPITHPDRQLALWFKPALEQFDKRVEIDGLIAVPTPFTISNQKHRHILYFPDEMGIVVRHGDYSFRLGSDNFVDKGKVTLTEGRRVACTITLNE
jgi:hypothetical protein